MEAVCREKINEDSLRKAVNALLKWKKKKLLLHSQSDHPEEAEEEEGDDFIYLSITLKKVPPRDRTLAPHRIPLRHCLLSRDYSALNLCLIVDGKRITSELAHKVLKAQAIPHIKQILKLSKLKSDYKSFESKKTLYDSYDVFFATKSAVPLLPGVLGRVFYKKKGKIPVPVDLRADGSNWKEEIERACNSSLLCLGSGTCSAVRVGRWGVTEGEEIMENVFEAIDSVLQIVPKKWGGIKCLHLKFSDSVALPIYEHQSNLDKRGDDGSGRKRKRSELPDDSSRKK
ncbi:hypothetical protein ACS0TY_011313 [Phlomoides rotata]